MPNLRQHSGNTGDGWRFRYRNRGKDGRHVEGGGGGEREGEREGGGAGEKERTERDRERGRRREKKCIPIFRRKNVLLMSELFALERTVANPSSFCFPQFSTPIHK